MHCVHHSKFDQTCKTINSLLSPPFLWRHVITPFSWYFLPLLRCVHNLWIKVAPVDIYSLHAVSFYFTLWSNTPFFKDKRTHTDTHDFLNFVDTLFTYFLYTHLIILVCVSLCICVFFWGTGMTNNKRQLHCKFLF